MLVVDDEPAMLAAMRRLLGVLPIRLLCVGSAEEALEIIRVRKPDAVVSDHGLPGISGLELLARLRSTHPRVRMLLHTGDGAAADRATQLDILTVAKGGPAAELQAAVWALACGDDDDGL